jgi:heme A synthase
MLTVLIDFSLGFYILNLGIGGLYLISAGDGEFPGWVSLLHLLIGTVTFLVIAWAYLICNTSPKVVHNG